MTRANARKRQNVKKRLTTVDDNCNVLRKRQQDPLGTTSKGSLGIMVSSQSSTALSIDSLVDDENI